MALGSVSAQNLVSNPSFENISLCPNSPGKEQYAIGWINVQYPQLSADLFATCASYSTECTVPYNGFGFQYTKQGNNYAGIVAGECCPSEGDYREFVETKLNDTLMPGKNYCVSFYVSLADSSGLAISNIGALFSDSLITQFFNFSTSAPSFYHYPPDVENPLSNIITDTMNWTVITGTYSPNSKKAYMVIGNMDLRSQMDTIRFPYINSSQNGWPFAYYYIDMVSVTLVKPVVARHDTTIANCDSIILGANYDDNATYTWWPKTGINDTTLANPTAQPSVTTTYYVKKVQCSSTTYDSIKIVVGACNVGIKHYAGSTEQVTVYPNPASSKIQVAFVGSIINVSICDMLGEEVLSTKQKDIDVSSLSEGVYFVKVETNNGIITKKVVVQR